MRMSVQTVQSFYDELEKIGLDKAVIGAGLATGGLAGLSAHFLQKADSRNDELLAALGRMAPTDVTRRKNDRDVRSLSAGLVAGGLGALTARGIAAKVPAVQQALGDEGRRAVKGALQELLPRFMRKGAPS